jgi:hypothetical protein
MLQASSSRYTNAGSAVRFPMAAPAITGSLQVQRPWKSVPPIVRDHCELMRPREETRSTGDAA